MRELDYLALKASEDEIILNQMIHQHEHFIVNCAYAVTHHYITKSDDEWSIALMAFVQAIHSYDLKKGSFLSFAKLVIHRRLVDYIRNQSRHNPEISVDPIIFDTEQPEEEEDVSMRIAVAEKVTTDTGNSVQLEIAALNDIFSNYSFSFMDLTDCSPQARKTKSACAKAINYVLDNPIIMNELKSKRQLPLITIEKNGKVPRKILERHRKYIIAAIEILSGEYPILAEYLRYIREEK